MLAGLTGGMGCGKSTVRKIFAELGWQTVDADEVCRELYDRKDNRLLEPLLEHWDKDKVLQPDGTANKKWLAETVFSHREEMGFLLSIILPLIDEESQKIFSSDPNPRKLFDVPNLFQENWDKKCDVTIAVWTNRQLQYQWLRLRGWSEKVIAQRLEFQLSADEKLERADYGLINTGTIEALKKQCIELSGQLLKKEA